MFTVAVTKDFVAQHFLVGSDGGPESSCHSHHYRVEVRLEGRTLNEHGYLVDILDIKTNLEGLLARYRDQTLNESPEFEGLNPSVENFARILCQALSSHIRAPNLNAITIKLWEDESAWAAFRQER